MKDKLMCGIICLGLGMVAGGYIVAKNPKLASKINKFAGKAEQTINDVKEDIQQKIEEAKQEKENQEETQNPSNLKKTKSKTK